MMQLLWRLLYICLSVCLWHTAAKLQQVKSMDRLSHESESESESEFEFESEEQQQSSHGITYSDYSVQQVDADNNQLVGVEMENLENEKQGKQKGDETETEAEQLLLANENQRPAAVQVKVTNEVESALMRASQPTVRVPPQLQQSNGNGHENDRPDIQNVMPSILQQQQKTNLMRANMVPISERHNYLANISEAAGNADADADADADDVAGIDSQMVDDEQLLRLQDYNLLYNAERQTYFQLHTSTGNQPTDTNSPASPSNGNRLLQQFVGNTLSAAFGLNNAHNGKDSTLAMTTQNVRLYDAASLRQSQYNPFHPTRIIIHGWLGNAHANIYSDLVPAYISLVSGKYNIFTVDWGRGAIADYVTASYRVKPVGQVLAKFLDFLHEEAGMRYEDLQLIGFSMGAHVAGLAAKHVQTGRVRVIRALDPALPFFRYAQEKERLTKQDADYVEVLHTSVGSYGFDRPLGHVDFYANWGSQQPGCFWHECSHWRAFALFKESLQQQRQPQPGEEHPAFEAKGCQPTEWQQLTRYKRCPHELGTRLHMGGDLGELSMEQLAQREGVYYFETNAKPPYDMGQQH